MLLGPLVSQQHSELQGSIWFLTKQLMLFSWGPYFENQQEKIYINKKQRVSLPLCQLRLEDDTLQTGGKKRFQFNIRQLSRRYENNLEKTYKLTSWCRGPGLRKFD